MRRSRTVEGGTTADENSAAVATATPNSRVSSKRERWSFAIKRRWFSSSTSRAASHDQEAAAITIPARTTLGVGNLSAQTDSSGSLPDRPDDSSSSSSGVSKRKSLRSGDGPDTEKKLAIMLGKVSRLSAQLNCSIRGLFSVEHGSIVDGSCCFVDKSVFFANSNKERSRQPAAHSAPSNSAPTSINGPVASSPLGVLSSGEESSQPLNASEAASAATCAVPSTSSASVLPQSGVAFEETDAESLPPPMQNITLNTMDEEKNDEVLQNEVPTPIGDDPKAMPTPVEDPPTEKANEKTPEELARFKRQYVLMELVETEQDYVRDLNSVVEGYIGNLEKMDLPQDLVGKDKIIFANIGQILDFHRTSFLGEIEKCLENYEAAGLAFVKYERRLHTLYVKYCQNKPKSDYLVSQDDFEQFFAETKAKLGHKVALCDLLIKPVQRIMKYQLLLKDILKFTERAHDKTDNLKKALQVMHVVPKACDDMMQVGRLQNFDGNLSAQGRLIHQGTLQISDSTAGTAQKPKDRRIFLFEQSAIIADHIPPKKEFGNPTYIFKNQIMVNKMVFDPNVSEDPLRFVIKSSDPSQPTAFIAVAQTQEEKDDWVRKIGEQLDQQKRLLAALVDPKRYMGGGDDVSSSMGSMSLGGNDKKTSAPSRFGGSSAPKSAKAESPKKESKSKLFSFGKSKPSSKSPTSPPPPLEAVAACGYTGLRNGELDLEEAEQVKILKVRDGYATVEREDGMVGKVPNYFLELADIPGETLADQIQYRRNWYATVDETSRHVSPVGPFADVGDIFSASGSEQKPVVVEDIEDLEAVEGEAVSLQPIISSRSDFTVVWRGPAVESRRARIEANGLATRLTLDAVAACDAGPYAVIARNDFGVTSSVAFLTVLVEPKQPQGVRFEVVGPRELRLKWIQELDVKYCVEYRSDVDEAFVCASKNIAKSHVAMRNFLRDVYEFRVFAYNRRLRSPASEVVAVDFSRTS
ncbi:unnamed protein product [Caenorhabditis auriculariae]|uniref:Uncharacterized protein n=1 Tax=Caenorhabditis auriculariae TaxID=2777116 RepID=A0A8S1GNV2_9PELO|nr:unnamed protein product [Caenorhabditis auriculariae]